MSSSTHLNFKQYLASANPAGAPIPAGLQDLLIAVADTCSTLSHEVAQGALIGLLGSAGTGNVQGEVQQKLDIIASFYLPLSHMKWQIFAEKAYQGNGDVADSTINIVIFGNH